MARGGRRRQTIGQGLDREVYQVARKIIDERNQYQDETRPSQNLNFATVYDIIRASSSSLNRRPKKLLEDSIERVLETIQQDQESDSEDAIQLEQEDHPRPKISNNLNRSIVGAWSNSSPATKSPAPSGDPMGLLMASTTPPTTTIPTTSTTTTEPPRKKQRRTAPVNDRAPPADVSFDNLGGIDPVIQQLEDLVILPMHKPEIFIEQSIQPPRGILLHGPAGCGKTVLASALAAELGVNFIHISAPSIVSGMSGESEKAIRDLFDEAINIAPCLMFFDEIDAITPKRESAQREMEKRIVAQLLTCMDSLALSKTNGKPVIVLAATNKPDSLDPALRRGGRFDKEINLPVPSEPVREQILRALTKDMKLADDVDLPLLAKRTPGFVGADLNDLVSTASSAGLKRYLHDLKQQSSQQKSMDVDGVSNAANANATNLRRFPLVPTQNPTIRPTRRIRNNPKHNILPNRCPLHPYHHSA
jgi:ribosome biogenesis ATPase